ncbi:YopX family protein [Streptococcus pneumoniae]|uniref:Phage protein n=1 Tax=Streptococcus pneumoniae TaxID=1313 RepID=A0AA95D924_STREE|nr:YopX family protein [Streptococcus pneumoniae]MDS2295436.1 YopX family protein [Streptococcus pneumoniae]MDS2574838.1 YopX family protein [Streptococcus pneumoniae]MDS2653378.1 YopX family protein [Streptococcus pneumoniae]MDS2764466.1 YopX family protein [Streptococcus pneumoniae]MDS3357527.1 YopX family protein [Streptococcus pneumoniae]
MIPKFRVWVKIGKRMVFSDDILAIDYENKEIVTQQVYFESGLAVERDIYCYDFDDIELMQSTGLKDKNGKEVFVGDIIKCTKGCPHEVYLEKEYGGTFIGGMPAVYLKGLGEGYAWTEDEEIIGNIYENPELLEDKQ